MRLETKKIDNFRLLYISGELIAEDSLKLKEEIMASTDNNDDYVFIDLTKVSRIDPLCMGILYTVYERSRELKNRVLFIV